MLKKYIMGLVLILPLVAFAAKPIVGQEPEIVIPKTIPQLITYYSEKYKVSEDLMTDIIGCETAHTFNPVMQSTVKYNFSSSKRGIVKGQQERSYGLAQIHLPDHPGVSYEQAIDKDFALDFMASNIAKGRVKMWSCYSLVR